MNILLEAYLDRNFGDDLFVTLLTDHYKEHQFYLMDNDSRGFSLVNCSQYGNLHTLTEEDALVQIEKFHAYVLVGGDFYPPYYSRYKGRVSTKTEEAFWFLAQACIGSIRRILCRLCGNFSDRSMP